MGNQHTEDKTFKKFTLTMENFSKLDSEEIYTETFFLSGHPWRIIFFPKRNNLDYLAIYLDAGDVANLPKGWSRYAIFKLALINQVNGDRTITKEAKQMFNARDSNRAGFHMFIHMDELCDSSNGFIVNDTCKVKAWISVRESEQERQVDEAVSKNDNSPVSAPPICVEPIEQTESPLPEEISMASSGDDLVDFRGLGKIEKAFVPMLEEVCSWHPSVVDCHKKRNRTRRFTEWAFTALGRVLHFLKTTKAKDMNDDACNHLQVLWEELESFGFDLSWLEPRLRSAVGMKSYIERAAQVKKLKENVDALEWDFKKATRKYMEQFALLNNMKANLDALEVDLKIATTNLVEARKGFIQRDLDAELGYRGPHRGIWMLN